MTTLVKKFIILVSAFVVLTFIYLLFPNKGNSVFWAIYSFGLKDLLIILFSALFMAVIKEINKIKPKISKISKVADLFAIGLMCYLSVPTIIRISCAIKAKFDYYTYREFLSNSEYSYLLLLILFFISILVYHGFRNERKNR